MYIQSKTYQDANFLINMIILLNYAPIDGVVKSCSRLSQLQNEYFIIYQAKIEHNDETTVIILLAMNI